MNHHLLHYSATLENPSTEGKVTLLQRIKLAMFTEGALIANNLKAFCTFLGITGIAVADAIATDPSPAREWTLTGALIIAIGYLVRSNAQKDKKIEDLYKQLLDDRGDDKKDRRR